MLTEKTNTNINTVSLNNRIANYADEIKQQVIVAALQEMSNNKQLRAEIEQAAKSLIKDGADDAKVDFKKIKEIIEKMRKVAERLGLRYELDSNNKGEAIVKIFNEITSKQVGTIPFNMMLAQISQGISGQPRDVSTDKDGFLV